MSATATNGSVRRPEYRKVLVGPDGAPLSRRSVSPMRTIGTSGAVLYGGYLQSNEKSASLRGTKRYETFSEMIANTAIVAASVRYYLNLVAKPTWSVEPADTTTEAKRTAAAIEGMLYDLATSWARVVKRAALYRMYGFSIQVWTAKRRDDGLVGIADVQVRPQRTIEKWHADETGTVLGAWQRSPQTFEEIYIPRARMIYAVDDALDDTPEGLGILRHAVDSSTRLQRLKNLEGIGYETDLRGIPKIRVPLAALQDEVEAGNMSETQRDDYIDPFETFTENHIRSTTTGLLMDSITYADAEGNPSGIPQYDFELVSGGGQGHESINRAIQRELYEIARVMGTEDLLVGSDGAGSLALSRDKTNKFRLLVDSALSELVEVFERDFVGPVMRLNGWPEALAPSLKYDSVRHDDIEIVAGTLERLARAGAVLDPDDPAINAVRDLAGLPRIELGSMERDAMIGRSEAGQDAPRDEEEEMAEAVESGAEGAGA